MKIKLTKEQIEGLKSELETQKNNLKNEGEDSSGWQLVDYNYKIQTLTELLESKEVDVYSIR